jgi:hypothetical protein
METRGESVITRGISPDLTAEGSFESPGITHFLKPIIANNTVPVSDTTIYPVPVLPEETIAEKPATTKNKTRKERFAKNRPEIDRSIFTCKSTT